MKLVRHLVVFDVDELVDRHGDDLYRFLHHLLGHVRALPKERVCVCISVRMGIEGRARLRDVVTVYDEKYKKKRCCVSDRKIPQKKSYFFVKHGVILILSELILLARLL